YGGVLFFHLRAHLRRREQFARDDSQNSQQDDPAAAHAAAYGDVSPDRALPGRIAHWTPPISPMLGQSLRPTTGSKERCRRTAARGSSGAKPDCPKSDGC